MGVRGLTTFIAKNQENYFKKHKLHDTHVVIDAHSLCAQLYKFHTKSNDSFGGDYDKYAKCIEYFFSMLQQCNITPIIVFDGGYEKKKIRTVYMRLKSKIKAVRKANPVSLQGETIFPLFVREVFRDIVLQLKLNTVRCDFEADYEIACIARQLNCPVISYDSDFYIFDVLYIPFPTMDYYTTKMKSENGSNHYISCKIYQMDNFLKQFGGLQRPLIPLMAALLGNDYIGKSTFRNFYGQLKTTRKKVGERGDQQRQITAVIKWLRTESLESAMHKILGRLKKQRRFRVSREIKKVIEGYKCSDSEVIQFLNISTQKCEDMETHCLDDIDTIATDSENDDSSSESLDGNETEEDMQLSEGEEKVDFSTVVESNEISYPDWFRIKYRKAEFPTLFMDLLSLRNCFYMPQVENTRNMQTLQISLPILRAIAKILLNKDNYFMYWARNDYGRVKKYNVEVSELELPSLAEIELLSDEKRRETFMLVLGMTKEDIQIVSQFPSSWQLYIYSLIYWAKNAVYPKVTLCHIYSIILCLFYLDIVDKKIGYVRLQNVLENKYGSKLKSILNIRKECNNKQTVQINSQDELCITIKNINIDDCIIFASSFVNNFTVDDKLLSNGRLFLIDTVDSFAQFQNCLYFAKHLNSLLSYPVEDCNISSFFNGTFLYNLHTNLESRRDIGMYVDLLLNKSVPFNEMFKCIVNSLKLILNLKDSETVRKKRRRKRKKADKKNASNSDVDVESKSESEIDVNNKFSILRLDV